VPPVIATEAVYVIDASGVRRLVAAAGDVIPDTSPAFGIVTAPDPPEAAVLPFEGYDELTEVEVVAMLPELDADMLFAVQAYERSHLARGAIHRYGHDSAVVTSRGTRLVAAESTSGGYDAMNVIKLTAEAEGRGLAVVGTGPAGKVLKKDLVAALTKDDAKAEGA
jgi:hypothetical protein